MVPDSVLTRMSVFCALSAEAARVCAREQLGDAEVENLDVAVAADHQILGLEVAVDDAGLVRLRQAFGDLNSHVERVAERQRARRDLLPQRLALDVLGRHVRAAAVLAELVDGEDVRVV